MSEFDILQQKILNYFPPVNLNIDDVYEEILTTYNRYCSIKPLKNLVDKEIYAPEILKTLKNFRILLRSELINERFIYEVNLIVKLWGKEGFYKKSILKSELVDLISKINIVYAKEKEMKMEMKMEKEKEMEKEEELMKYANETTLNYEIESLNNGLFNLDIMSQFSKFGKKRSSKIKSKSIISKCKNNRCFKCNTHKVDDLDLSALNITDNNKNSKKCVGCNE